MGTRIVNTFTTFELTPEEERNGNLLSPHHKMVLQNRRSMYAQERMNMELDLKDAEAFLGQEAYLKGKMDLITELLDSSEQEEAIIKQEQSQQQ